MNPRAPASNAGGDNQTPPQLYNQSSVSIVPQGHLQHHPPGTPPPSQGNPGIASIACCASTGSFSKSSVKYDSGMKHDAVVVVVARASSSFSIAIAGAAGFEPAALHVQSVLGWATPPSPIKTIWTMPPYTKGRVVTTLSDRKILSLSCPKCHLWVTIPNPKLFKLVYRPSIRKWLDQYSITGDAGFEPTINLFRAS